MNIKDMENLTQRQQELLKLGKQMKEIIKLSESLTFKGHPFVDEWVSQVRELVYKDWDLWVFYSFTSYKFRPDKNDLFNILTYLRRILKEEGIFSEEWVK